MSVESEESQETDNEIFSEEPENFTKLLIEKITNDAHFEDEGHLRCIISVRHPIDEHFFIFQK